MRVFFVLKILGLVLISNLRQAHGFSSCASVYLPPDKVIARLMNNNFTIDRPIFGWDGPLSSYEELFDPSFKGRILKKGIRVLDSGAGRGRSGLEFSNIDAAVYAEPAGFLRNRYNHVFVGNIIDPANPIQQVKPYDVIVDNMGPFVYLTDAIAAQGWTKKSSIKQYLELIYNKLNRGGYFYSAFDALILDRDENRIPIVDRNGNYILKPGFQVLDEHGRDVTEHWFRSLRGLKLVSNIHQKNRRFQERGFHKTSYEEVNDTRALTLQRTSEELYVPDIQQIYSEDGRPPIRVFRWQEQRP